MKKIAAILLSLIMLSSLFSCNSEKINDNENTDDNTNTAEASSQEDIDAAPTAKTQAEVAIERYLNSLAYYPTPNSQTPLCECERLGHAYVDLDGDSVNELVIDCGSILILRYYEGCVYLYEFTFRQLYNLNTDGSYNWNHNGADFEYGEDRIYFEGAELKTRELYRIVNNAEYYVEGKQVTEEELQKYIEDNPKTKIEFLPLEVSWQKEITPEEALQIASEYWEIEDGFTDYGAGSMWVHRIIMLDPPSYARGYYHIGLQVDHYGRDQNDLRVLLGSSLKHLFVNSVTGECQGYEPIYSEHSLAFCIRIAEIYWEDFDIEENGYVVTVGYNERAPESVYVVILRQYVIDHYSTIDEIWIDKNTGEMVIPSDSDGEC